MSNSKIKNSLNYRDFVDTMYIPAIGFVPNVRISGNANRDHIKPETDNSLELTNPPARPLYEGYN